MLQSKYSNFVYCSVLLIAALILLTAITTREALALSLAARLHHKSDGIPKPPRLPIIDLHSPQASPEAVALANRLHIMPLFQRLENLHLQVQEFSADKLSLDVREDLRDTKEAIRDTIEQTRLELGFAEAELSAEIAVQSELLRDYLEIRDNHINAVNNWSFRTNGVLWAIAEGLDIPTYNNPKLSIPSGSIGILAGIVPSVFSLIAVKDQKANVMNLNHAQICSQKYLIIQLQLRLTIRIRLLIFFMLFLLITRRKEEHALIS